MIRHVLPAFLLSAALSVASLVAGPEFINPLSPDPLQQQVLLSVRLPRLLTALLMGSALAVAGAILQGMLRNPLADPYILGISGGAALSAGLSLLFGLAAFGRFSLSLSAFLGALAAGLILVSLSRRRGALTPERLLLAGVGLGFLFWALLTLIMSVSTDAGLRRTALWIFGDLASADWQVLPFGAALVAAGIGVAVARARGLNALMLGDDLAHSLGFSPNRERAILFISVALLVSTSVSLGGMIGFVGLIIPHLVRFFAGADCRLVIPLSALSGGAFLCVADAVGRTLISPVEIPAGIVSALIGAPYFLFLLRRKVFS